MVPLLKSIERVRSSASLEPLYETLSNLPSIDKQFWSVPTTIVISILAMHARNPDFPYTVPIDKESPWLQPIFETCLDPSHVVTSLPEDLLWVLIRHLFSIDLVPYAVQIIQTEQIPITKPLSVGIVNRILIDNHFDQHIGPFRRSLIHKLQSAIQQRVKSFSLTVQLQLLSALLTDPLSSYTEYVVDDGQIPTLFQLIESIVQTPLDHPWESRQLLDIMRGLCVTKMILTAATPDEGTRLYEVLKRHLKFTIARQLHHCNRIQCDVLILNK